MLSPAILALLCCTALVCVITLVASIAGLSVMYGWNPDDSGQRQLARERRTLLVEAALKVALAGQLLSVFLFVATADHLHPLFTGAMCAAGVLNVNPFGHPTLLVKVAAFLLCGLWLLVNRASVAAASTGLVRFKHIFLILIAGTLVAENVLQYRYFTDLDPEIITSCCATIFSEEADGVGSALAALPVRESRIAFVVLLLLTCATGWRSLSGGRSVMLFSLFAALLGVVSLAAITTWVAPSFYELPTHRCPFCLLSSRYGYVGHLLYACLAVGVLAGVGSGLVDSLRRINPLQSIRPAEERRLCLVAMVGFALFSVIAAWPLVASDFRLEGY